MKFENRIVVILFYLTANVPEPNEPPCTDLQFTYGEVVVIIIIVLQSLRLTS